MMEKRCYLIRKKLEEKIFESVFYPNYKAYLVTLI